MGETPLDADGAGAHDYGQQRVGAQGNPCARGVSSARPGSAKDVTVNAQIGMMLSATTPLAIRAQSGPLPDSA